MEFASLCILTYKRPERLHACLTSLFETIDFPCEIIVNSDGGNDEANSFIFSRFTGKQISKVVFNNGYNRGVGRAFQNCLGVAEGDYIFKIDDDLTFDKGWLSRAVNILRRDRSIGALGLFDYNKWDPNDPRFTPQENVIEDKGEYQIVKDFVSSIYGFREEIISQLQHRDEIPDDGFHQRLKLITKSLSLCHSVINTAFGVGKSVYVSGTMDHPVKTATFNEPLLFKTE
jgi:glycosyltransferase involved in cell wall biosynthesis